MRCQSHPASPRTNPPCNHTVLPTLTTKEPWSPQVPRPDMATDLDLRVGDPVSADSACSDWHKTLAMVRTMPLVGCLVDIRTRVSSVAGAAPHDASHLETNSSNSSSLTGVKTKRLALVSSPLCRRMKLKRASRPVSSIWRSDV